MSAPRLPKKTVITGSIAAALLLGWLALWRAEHPARLTPDGGARADAAATKTAGTPLAPVSKAPTAAVMAAPGAGAQARRDERFAWFARRPFKVARERGSQQWTAEDGRDPDAILELAHNELEVERLMEENGRIKRRQLVYRNETVPMLLERLQGTGEPLRRITLPGLNGQEVQVEVTRVEGSLQGGAVTGRVQGRFNSTVSVGFANGYESFNILSPEDGLFLTADAREPGEVIVKEIDPDQYAPGAGEEPDYIVTTQTAPQAPHK